VISTRYRSRSSSSITAMRRFFFLLLLYAITLGSCQKKTSKETSTAGNATATAHPAPAWQQHRDLSYRVIKELPHDTRAFTQGLIVQAGNFIESTGGHNTTWLRKVEIETGKILIERKLSAEFFGEGLTELNGKLYQLTWQNQQGFIYDATTLAWQKNFSFQGEGWGLTDDGTHLIMSNGSAKLQFIDPKTYRVAREITVADGGNAIGQLNELEFIEGEIFANIWHTNRIIRIDPKSGKVLGTLDLTDIHAKESITHPDHVLNGIAYDTETQALFVTGKCWPKIYQIALEPEKGQ
jgi:glutamine cyclotransferase